MLLTISNTGSAHWILILANSQTTSPLHELSLSYKVCTYLGFAALTPYFSQVSIWLLTKVHHLCDRVWDIFELEKYLSIILQFLYISLPPRALVLVTPPASSHHNLRFSSAQSKQSPRAASAVTQKGECSRICCPPKPHDAFRELNFQQVIY